MMSKTTTTIDNIKLTKKDNISAVVLRDKNRLKRGARILLAPNIIKGTNHLDLTNNNIREAK